MSDHYVQVDGTSWPVNLEDVAWALRYANPDVAEQRVAASAVDAYRHLTNPGISQADAVEALKRARRAQVEALAWEVPS
jgi:hypothetical protein